MISETNKVNEVSRTNKVNKMDWPKIADLVEQGESASKHILTDRSWRAESKGLLYTWQEWVAATSEKNITAAYSDVQRCLVVLYPNRETMHVMSIDWRRPVGVRFGKKSEIYRQSVYQLGLSREESLQRRETYEARVRHDARNITTFIPKEKVFQAISSCAASDDPIANLVAVCLSTGSRLVEVLKVSNFLESEAGPGFIVIDGVAKSAERKILIRPLLGLTCSRVLELILRIRKFRDFKKMTNVEAKNAVDAAANRIMRDLFNLTFHKCRYIYAALAWHIYGMKTPQQEWVRETLGHSSGDISLIYLMFVIS